MKEQKCLKIQRDITTERILEQKVKYQNKTVYDPTVPLSFTVSCGDDFPQAVSFHFSLSWCPFFPANISDLSSLHTHTFPCAQNKPISTMRNVVQNPFFSSLFVSEFTTFSQYVCPQFSVQVKLHIDITNTLFTPPNY